MSTNPSNHDLSRGSVPCIQNAELDRKIKIFSEILKTQAHNLGQEEHGLDETEFYQSGLFRGAIERIRGQYSATMRDKRDFVQAVLNYMQDRNFISEWNTAGESNRHDYSVRLNSGRTAVIELKGCLDGNNTNIFERPSHAHEFIIWSVCSNPGADPRHNVWSGIHTRLSAEIISRGQVIDGLVVWDMICGTLGRPCPKLAQDAGRMTEVGQFRLPPPCIYLFPSTIPTVRNNPSPDAQRLEDCELLGAFYNCFNGKAEEINQVTFLVANQGSELVRQTTVIRNGQIHKQSAMTAIQRA